MSQSPAMPWKHPSFTINKLPKPENDEQARRVVLRAANYITAHLADKHGHVYRASRAEEVREADCYAYAEGLATVFEELEVPSLVILTPTHASNAAFLTEQPLFVNAERVFDNIITLDDVFETKQNPLSDSGTEQLTNFYKYLHDKHTAESQQVAAYCWFENDVLQTLEADPTALHGVLPLTNVSRAHLHVVMSPQAAVTTMHAVGDLKRYSEDDPAKYREKWPELIGVTPDFFNNDLVKPVLPTEQVVG